MIKEYFTLTWKNEIMPGAVFVEGESTTSEQLRKNGGFFNRND